MTNSIRYDTLILSVGRRVFYCPQRQLAGGELDRFPADTQRLSFLLEDKMPQCLDCGKDIEYRSTRCRPCYLKIAFRGERNPKWKGGICVKNPKEYYSKKNRKRWLKLEPWGKTYENIRRRFYSRNSYYVRWGIKISITLEDLKYLWHRDKAYLLKRPSIDRIDPLGHYELKNCRYIEFNANNLRSRKILQKVKEKYPDIYFKCIKEV